MPALTTTPDRDRSLLQPFGIGFAVAGGLAIAGSAYYGVRAKQISNEIGDHPASEPWPLDIYEREQQGMLYERRALALLIGGGALVATGAVMYLVGRPHTERWTVAPTTTRGGAAVSLAGHV
jgi:hypothetical protein